MRKSNKQHGSVTIEFIVSMFVFVPIFLAIMAIGKEADMKSAAISAARYQAWERTVWADPGSPWTDQSAATKTDMQIVQEFNHRILEHRQNPILSINETQQAEIVNDPLWQNYKMNQMLDKGEDKIRSSKHAIDEVEPKGFDIASTVAAMTALPKRLNTGQLNTGNMISSKLSLPFQVRISQFPGRFTGDCSGTERSGNEQCDESKGHIALSHKVSAGILSDSWTPNDEQQFQSIVSSMSIMNREISGDPFPGEDEGESPGGYSSMDFAIKAHCLANTITMGLLSFFQTPVLGCHERSAYESQDLPSDYLSPYDPT